LPAIREETRRLESELWEEFATDYPRLFGALLHAVSAGLRVWPTVKVPALPRMADFGQWGEAVCRGLGWEAGLFLAQYKGNRREACASALGDCPIAGAMRRLVDYADQTWRGTAGELFAVLSTLAPPHVSRSGRWPKSPMALGRMLRRIAPQLSLIGITVRFDRAAAERLITISPGPSTEQ